MQVVGAVEHETMATGESQMFTGGVRMTDGASYSFGYTDDGQENPDEAGRRRELGPGGASRCLL